MKFFSVDVETTGLTPFSGQLLSVGIVVVDEDTNNFTGHEFYDGVKWSGDRGSSSQWWDEQEVSVRQEAFGFKKTSAQLAIALNAWVNGVEPIKEQRCFVANPVSFDKMWVDCIFEAAAQSYHDDDDDIYINPFPYRSLCLRSMRFGLDPEFNVWGMNRLDTYPSKRPHCAIEDARAQAFDFMDLIERMKRRV